jgi:hypothetical protein
MTQKPFDRRACGGLRDSLRLIAANGCVEFHPASLPRIPIYVTLHRFNETIGGRAYHIEVTPVSNRWRAQLARTPGLPTAMMPFYGSTPAEAAQLLAKWLTLAHARVQGTQPTAIAPAPQIQPKPAV